jgi:hypothetical protein
MSNFTWPAGKTFGELTPEQKRAAIRQAAARLQDELTRNAAAISAVLDTPLPDENLPTGQSLAVPGPEGGLMNNDRGFREAYIRANSPGYPDGKVSPMRFKIEISARYQDPCTGAVTEITFSRTDVEAPDTAGAKVSGLGLARSVSLAELLDDPGTRSSVTAVLDPRGS